MVNLFDGIYLAAKLIYLATAMKPFVIAALILLALCACDPGDPEKDMVLDLNPNTDSIYHYSVVVSESSQMNDKKSITVLAIDYSLHCIESKDSLRTFELVFENVAEQRKALSDSQVSNAAGDTSSVTGTEPGHPNAGMQSYFALRDSIFKKLINQSLVITCTDEGKVLSVTGFDEMAQKVSSGFKDDTRTITALIRNEVGPRNITDVLHQSLFYMRNQKIDTGSSWVNNIVLTARAPVKYSNMIEVKRIVGDSVYLDVKAMMSAKTGEEGVVYDEGEQTGTVLTSLSTGMPIQMFLSETSTYKTDTYSLEKGKTFSLRTIRK